MDGIAGDEIVSFRFTNDNEQNVMFTASNGTFQPILKIKDPTTDYVESISATDCGQADCDDMIFTINGLPSGQYIAEMIPIENGGQFKVNMMCSNESVDGEGTLCPL